MAAPVSPRSPAAADTPSRHAERRRTFAIISHPDAGKTTLTEKLLLYAGALAEAGHVKARSNRRAVVSDWMQLERERGISVTASALRFQYDALTFNLLDTPGHRDFTEDTQRVLAAADSAVMLLDAARGIEAQTLELFRVARERRIPLITFVNKLDRPALEPLALIDEIERELGVEPTPVTWPVGMGEEFSGVVDRRDGSFHRFTRTPRGSRPADEQRVDSDAARHPDDPDWAAAEEELALLDATHAELDPGAHLSGESTPVFFGSALSNFGVRLLLEALVELAPPPSARPSADGKTRELDAEFSGQVFKLQANLDPRHRDRLAFLRVCSGRFERGMKVTNARTGRALTVSYAHELFAQVRHTIDEAFPGDIIGLINPGDLHTGDTLYAGPPVDYPPVRTLVPQRYAFARNLDTGRYKQFRRGLAQLHEEGVVHLMHEPDVGPQAPILAGFGQMQFEVASFRMANEFGAEIALEPARWQVARRTDDGGADAVRSWTRGTVLETAGGATLAAFRDDFELQGFQRAHPDATLDGFLSD